MSDKFSVPKVFFDSDALVAASASRQGADFILLQLSELGLIQGFISQKVGDECRKNLHNKLPEALCARLFALCSLGSLIPQTIYRVCQSCLDRLRAQGHQRNDQCQAAGQHKHPPAL